MSWTEYPPHAGLGSNLFRCIGLAREFLTKFVSHSISCESPENFFFFFCQPIWFQLIQLFGFRDYILEKGCLSPKRGVTWAGLTAFLPFHCFPIDLGLGRSAPVVGNSLASDPSLWIREQVKRHVSSSTFGLLQWPFLCQMVFTKKYS